MFGYDPEAPAGYQDADIEMLELRDAAFEREALCETGNHEWHNVFGETICYFCNKTK